MRMSELRAEYEAESQQPSVRWDSAFWRDGVVCIPHSINRTHRLSHSMRAVLILLMDHADEKGEAWPGHDSMALDADLSIRTVERALQELHRTGMVSWQRRGQGKTNIYTLHQDGFEQFIGQEHEIQTRQNDESRPANMTRHHVGSEPATMSGLDTSVWRTKNNQGNKNQRTIPSNICATTKNLDIKKPQETELLSPIPASKQTGNAPPSSAAPPQTEAAETPPDAQLPHAESTPDHDSAPGGPATRPGENTGLPGHSRGMAKLVKVPWVAPEWWEAMTRLDGYRGNNHQAAVDAIRGRCEARGVTPEELVSDWASFYPLGQINFHWKDPVKALCKPRVLDIQIDQMLERKRRGQNAALTSRGMNEKAVLPSRLSAAAKAWRREYNQKRQAMGLPSIGP